ncbi:MAG: cytochrome C biogenesis protein, partial [Acetobacteraceae bacterium]
MRALLLLLALLGVPVAEAAESPAIRSPRATATLVADRLVVAPGEEFRLGLRLRLAPGWHTYWRNPGDAGAPPELSLTLPAGGSAGAIEWPAPQRIPTGPLVSFGYEGEVLLPVRVTAPATGGSLAIEAEASWLVCAELCIPEEGRFRLELPMAPASRLDPALAPLFTTAEAAIPRPSPWAARAALAGGRGSLTLTGEGLSPASLREANFFPDEGGLLDNAAAQPLRLSEGAMTLG